MNQRECAACGKLFQPKGRERYCEGPHYKPCPVCGEMVVATYWSDPPKRCEKCRAANARVATRAVGDFSVVIARSQSGASQLVMNVPAEVDNPTVTIDMGDDNVRKYIGPEGRGIPFKNGHSYIIKMEKEEKYNCYIVTSEYDITSEENIKAYIRYSSMNSISRYFEKQEIVDGSTA